MQAQERTGAGAVSCFLFTQEAGAGSREQGSGQWTVDNEEKE